MVLPGLRNLAALFAHNIYLQQQNPMIIEVTVPSPGESITEVEIESWLVSSGDTVEMDTELAEINSDKATLTVNAEQGGVIEIIAQEGDTVEVGQVIAKIDTEGAGAAPAKEEKAAAPAAETPAAPAADNGSSYAAGVPSPSAEKIIKEKGRSLTSTIKKVIGYLQQEMNG